MLPPRPPHQPTFCCSSHSPDTCPHPVLHISRPSAVRLTLQTLAPTQSSTSADLLLFVPLSRHLLPPNPPHQPTFWCSSHSSDTCPHPVIHISRPTALRPTLQTLAPTQSSTSADLLLFVPLSRHLPPSSHSHQPSFCCSSHSPDTCPIKCSTSADLLLFVPLSRHMPPSSHPHQPTFCCSSHSPDTCLIQSSTSADLLLLVPLSRHLPPSIHPHQPTFCCSSYSPDTCPIQSSTSAYLQLSVPLSRHLPHPVLHISRPSAVRPTLQTLAPIQSSTSADLLLFVPLSRHLLPPSPPHQPTFCCSSHSPDTCPHPFLHISRPSAIRPTLQTLAPTQSSTSADLLLFVPLSRHLPPSSHPHKSTYCCSSHSPDTCSHPVLHISRSSAVRPTLQTLAPIQSSTSADLLLFVPLSRHLPHPVLHISRPTAVRPTLQTHAPSSHPHQPTFCCSSHSPDTCPHPVIHISRPSAVRPTLQTHASSSPPHQPIFCCSSHSPDTCPHPFIHISRPSAVRHTLQTLAPSSPPHQPTFCCSSHSPDTCPHPVLHISRPSAVRPSLQTLAPIQSSTSADLLLFVPLSRHLPPSSPPHQPTFCCSSHSPDTCPHPVIHISRPSGIRPTLQTHAPIQASTSADLLLFVPLSRYLPASSPPHPSHNISLVFLCFFGIALFLLVLISSMFGFVYMSELTYFVSLIEFPI